MNKLIGICLIICISIVLLIFVIPLKGKWFVNDLYVYGVKDMREIFPESNYVGKQIRGGDFTWIMVDSRDYTGEWLSIYNYWKIKKLGMLGNKIE